jgi:2-hydroxychromene-2-carboxylate isomerase
VATWYFDFVSPFSYLQFAAYPQLFARQDVTLAPVLFAGLLNHWGQKGPAEIEPKRLHTYRHVQWQAAKFGVALKFPPAHPFNSLHVLRLAIALDAAQDAVKTIFDFIWAEGRSPIDDWTALCGTLGVRDADALIASHDAKSRLRANTETAISEGVFGVPTFVIDGTVFWGIDATEMLLDYRRDPQLFATPEMQRIAGLPVAAVRKERNA